MRISLKVLGLIGVVLATALVAVGLSAQENREPDRASGAQHEPAVKQPASSGELEFSSRLAEMQLVEIATERWKLVQHELRASEAGLHEAIQAAGKLLRARLAHADSASEHAAIYGEHAQRLNALKNLAQKLYEAGRARPSELLAVEAELLKAQLQAHSGNAEVAAEQAKGAQQQSIALPGQLQPAQQVNVHAKIAGFVDKVHVGLGDSVKKGQVLVELSVPELKVESSQKAASVALAQADEQRVRAGLMAAEAARQVVQSQAAQAEADLQGAQAGREFRQVEIKRLQRLRDNQSIPAERLDEAQFQAKAAEAALSAAKAKLEVAQGTVQERSAEIAKAKADMAAAKARIREAEAGLRHAEAIFQYTQLRAPFDGIVSRISAAPGALARSAASDAAEPLLTVIQTDPIRVVVDLPEDIARRVSKGTSATIRLPARKRRDFDANVTRVGAMLDPTSRTLRAEIELANPQGQLLPGMHAIVTLAVKDDSGSDSAHKARVSAEKSAGNEPRKLQAVEVASLDEAKSLLPDTTAVTVHWRQQINEGDFTSIMTTLARNPLVRHLTLRLPNSSHVKDDALNVLRDFKALESLELIDGRDWASPAIFEQIAAAKNIKELRVSFQCRHPYEAACKAALLKMEHLETATFSDGRQHTQEGWEVELGEFASELIAKRQSEEQ